MELVGNNKAPLWEVFQQKTGLHTYRDHTLAEHITSTLRCSGLQHNVLSVPTLIRPDAVARKASQRQYITPKT